MGSLIASAKYRGEFEERFKTILKEETASQGQIVLFIDEIHTVVCTGADGETIGASNLHKPMLYRGELRCIGATTLAECRRHIEKDPQLGAVSNRSTWMNPRSKKPNPPLGRLAFGTVNTQKPYPDSA